MFLSYAGGFAETVEELADYEKAGVREYMVAAVRTNQVLAGLAVSALVGASRSVTRATRSPPRSRRTTPWRTRRPFGRR